MPDVRAIWRYWRQHPPADWLAAAYLKYRPPSDPAAQAATGNLADLAAIFGATPGLKLIQGGRA